MEEEQLLQTSWGIVERKEERALLLLLLQLYLSSLLFSSASLLPSLPRSLPPQENTPSQNVAAASAISLEHSRILWQHSSMQLVGDWKFQHKKELQAAGRSGGRCVRCSLAGWLAGWLGPTALSWLPRVLFLPNGKARERERECVCFSSGERRGSYFANPQIFSSLLCAIAFLSSSSPCHSLLLSCCGRLSLSCRARTYSTFLRRCLCSVVCFLSLCVCASALEIQETTDSLSDP